MRHRMKLGGVVTMGVMVAAFAAAPFAVAAQAQEAAAPAAAVVPADEQPTNQQLTRLFEVMRIKEQMESTSKIMPQLMQQQFDQQAKEMEKDHPELKSMTPEQQKASQEVMSKFMGKAMNLYTGDEMMDDMKAIYKRHLTKSDVDGIIAFYSSPAGKHMLDMVPVIMQEFMPEAMERMQSRMQPLILEMQKELMEISHSAPAGKTEQK